MIEPRGEDIVLIAKADLAVGELTGVSGMTGQGVDALVEQIGAILSRARAAAPASPPASGTGSRWSGARPRLTAALQYA